MTRPIVVCGAQKSCSTSFAAALAEHERVVMHSLECLALERGHGVPAWTVGRQAQRLRSRSTALCVKRPEFLHIHELGRRAAATFDGGVAVVILREPFARFRSAFHHYRHFGLLADPSPEGYLERWMRGQHPSRGIWAQPGDFSFYGDALEHLMDAFAERVEVFFQDEVLTEPSSCLRHVWRAAELDPDAAIHQQELPRLNIGSGSHIPSRLGMVGARLGVRRSRFGTVLPRRRPLRNLGSAILAVPAGHLAHTTQTPPTVTADFVELLRPDLARVERLVGRSVPASWLLPEISPPS